MSGWFTYIKAAFNAQPFGMAIPPNWIGLAAFGLLGLTNPGWWVIGLGVESAYLLWLATSSRFQAVVDGQRLNVSAGNERQRWAATGQDLLQQIGPEGRRSYMNLESRCREIMGHLRRDSPDEAAMQDEGLSRLQWVFLRLLGSRASIRKLVVEAGDGEAERLQERAKELIKRLEDKDMAEDLRTSIRSQLEIVQSRLAKQREAHDKLAYIDAELARIEEQVGLLRDQALMASDPKIVSARIDQISAGLGSTSEWINRQQTLLGSIGEPMGAPPPALSIVSDPLPNRRVKEKG